MKEENKVAVLLTVIGPETYGLVNTRKTQHQEVQKACGSKTFAYRRAVQFS